MVVLFRADTIVKHEPLVEKDGQSRLADGLLRV